MNQKNTGFRISYPTIRGTVANLPSKMDLVGKSVMTLSSITGQNTLYPEAVLPKCVNRRACTPTEDQLTMQTWKQHLGP